MDEPTSPLLRKVGRAYVRECRGRRLHPFVLRVGTLGGTHVVVPHEKATDAGLRVDLLERILEESEIEIAAALPWITRGGALAPGDADFAWFTASREAFGRYGVRLPAFYVITREGWLDLAGDAMQPWRPPRP